MIRLTTLLLALSIVTPAARADDLDVMVDETVSVEIRAEAQTRLNAVEFRSIISRLSELISSHRVESRPPSGMRSHCETPEKLNERERIGCKLRELWRQHMAAAKGRGDDMELMLGLLEDPSVGLGKSLVVWEVSSRLQIATEHRWTLAPPVPEVLQRLDRFVRDARESDELRRVIIDALLQNSDQNKYLDLALELSSAGDTPVSRSKYFQFCTRACRASKLSLENRGKYVRQGFRLLEEIDDGHSGRGYFLAMQVGEFIGIPPVREGQGSFAADSELPEYREPGGLKKKFFQNTVNNARKWWEENKAAW
jgi:hypothetical protein